MTLDRRRCLALDAIFLGVMKNQTGNADIVVAGGMDRMSVVLFLATGYVKGFGHLLDRYGRTD